MVASPAWCGAPGACSETEWALVVERPRYARVSHFSSGSPQRLPLSAQLRRACPPPVNLLVCIVDNTAKVNEIIAGWADIGVTGATVLESHGTVDIAVENVPVFAGFRHLLRGDRQANRLILSVIRDDDLLDRAMALAEEACGDLDQPATGILFTVPVTRVRGLKPNVG